MGWKRKYLSSDGLIEIVRHSLAKEKFQKCRSIYSWQDCILCGLALYGLKMPSLLQFEKAKEVAPIMHHNLRTLYGVQKAPSDTCIRERLDRVSPRQLRGAFKDIFAHLQRGKVLESYQTLDGRYIIAIDGTGQYSSSKIHCQSCCEKHHRDGRIEYHHQMLAAILVHPDHSQVIPFAPEPIVKSDGASKNDCESNASKRLLRDLRKDHPRLKVIITQDSLASNYPHLSLLDSLNMEYVIAVKPGSHKSLFDWIKGLEPIVYKKLDRNGVHHTLHVYENAPLNDTNHDYRVNVLEAWEAKADGGRQHFTWVTKLPLTAGNVYDVMRVGRSRWKIENEMFNVMKNQGYNLEHSYGHGHKYLCSSMAMLAVLSFAIDQVKQLCCKIYQQARSKRSALSALFSKVRESMTDHAFEGWHEIYARVVKSGSREPMG
jgi:hypothetical protein